MHIAQSLFAALHHLIYVVIGIMGIGFLIGFHELGHFLFCKLFKIHTPSFSIGMGPRIFTKKIGETEFSLSAIPLGGYVEIAGLAEVGQGNQDQAGRSDDYSFNRKPYYQKMLVMFGGILLNLAFAYFALTLLFFMGLPKSPLVYPHYASTTISSVETNSPAQQFGLQPGDRIVSIDGNTVASGQEIIKAIQDRPNQTINVSIDHDGHSKEFALTLASREVQTKEFGYLGVDFELPTYSLTDSIKHGIQATNYLIYQVWAAFKGIFTQRKIDNLGGPLMVISQTIKGAAKGFKIFLLFLAFISVNLAILNLIPLPIFDGGQMLFTTIETILRRPLPEKVREGIHYATWIGVILLAVYLSVKDVLRIFWSK